MAHLVQTMAYVGQTPWHGLGNRLTSNQPLEVWAQQSGINFDIRETPVRFMTETAGNLGAIHEYPDQKVLFRSDTKAALSVVSQRFHVVQPREILEFYRDLTEISGFELETAGVLKGGKKIWALARTNQSTTLKGNDTMKGYLLLATACDGSLATTAQLTSIRVVCNNTLAVALNHGKDAVRVPHSTRFDAQAVKKQLGVSVSAWDEFMYRMKQLADRPVTNKEAEDFCQQVFQPIVGTKEGNQNDRAMKHVLHLFNGHGRGAELASANGTAFGLLNAVTQFVDHERRTRTPDTRLDSAWFGAGATLKQKALDRAMLMAA